MMNDRDRISNLILKLLEDNIDADELKELEEWKNSHSENAALLERLTDPYFIQNEMRQIYQYDQKGEAVLNKILKRKPKHKFIRLVYSIGVAALVISIMLACYFFGNYNVNTDRSYAAKSIGKSITERKPSSGTISAVLTLHDGSNIKLDSVASGLIACQGHTEVIKYESGLISYELAGTFDKAYDNILTAHRNKKSELKLPDGSMVVLNAGSSIRFPTVFNGADRRVELMGEAFFEISQNTKPFHVDTDSITVTLYQGSTTIKSHTKTFPPASATAGAEAR